jgi:DNA repair ATPase RecN
MIKSLKIQNVQSHKKTKLSFSPGVNMVIGKSDNGKSAIFNSLFWCMYNRPLGDPHRNWDGGVMEVKTVLDNGTVMITRDKQTEYLIRTPEKNTVNIFKASGQSPPEEVTKLFNMDRKINVQRQLERDAPIFLISESPGEVAAFLNKVAGLYKIDETVSKGKSDLRDTKQKLDTVTEQIKEKQNELLKYAGIDKLHAKVLTCTQIVKNQAENKRILAEIDYLLNSIGEIGKCIDDLKEKVQIKNSVDACIQWISFKKLSTERKNKIESVLKTIDLREHRQKKLLKKIEVQDKIDFVETKLDSLLELRIKKDNLFEVLDGTEMLEKYQKQKKEYLEKQEKEFHELMPEQCPLCGGKV